MSQPDLSILIVNWNSTAYLRKCLATLFAQTKGLDFEVVVIDSASFDGCGEMLQKEFPVVKFLQSRENIGFAASNNLAFRHSSGRTVVFLNPDTEIVGPALKTMWDFVESTPQAGAVGCKLLNTDSSIQTSCVQRYPTLLNQFLDSELLRRLFPRAKVWGTQSLLEDGAPVAVEVISGACLMMKRSVCDQVGHFSTDYFMYAEDVDLCYRAQRAGYRNCYVGQATVVHHGGGSSTSIAKNNFAAIVVRDSLWKFLRKHRGPLYAAAYRISTALQAIVRVALLVAVLGVTLGQFRRHSLWLSLVKWTRLLSWAAGGEGWARQLAHKSGLSDDLLQPPAASLREEAPLRGA